eukprot:scaffold1143_cov198-Alexandrium_tamarense.AAC.6
MLNCAIRTAARATSRRQMSTASPKMHKAKDVWGELKATRPPEGHPHVSNWLWLPLISGLVCGVVLRSVTGCDAYLGRCRFS